MVPLSVVKLREQVASTLGVGIRRAVADETQMLRLFHICHLLSGVDL
jgi:hypothetical protein